MASSINILSSKASSICLEDKEQQLFLSNSIPLVQQSKSNTSLPSTTQPPYAETLFPNFNPFSLSKKRDQKYTQP